MLKLQTFENYLKTHDNEKKNKKDSHNDTRHWLFHLFTILFIRASVFCTSVYVGHLSHPCNKDAPSQFLLLWIHTIQFSYKEPDYFIVKTHHTYFTLRYAVLCYLYLLLI
jgi:hypothetical protein